MAKNFNKSSYALNKYSNGIVYDSVDGAYVITEELFLAENPGMTHEDFMFWKNFSDEDYLEELRADTREKRHTVSLSDIEETELVSTQSVEDAYMQAIEEVKCPHTLEHAMRILDEAKLTPSQKERYIAYHCSGKSYEKIGNEIGVNAMAVYRSVTAAEKKIKKYFSKHGL